MVNRWYGTSAERGQVRASRSQGVALIWLLVVALIAGCAGGGPVRKDNGAQVDTRTGLQFRKGLSLMEAQLFDEAIDVFTELTTRRPALSGPWANLGIAHARLGDLEAAEHALRTAVKLRPDNAAAWNELGMVYRRAGRFEPARQAYAAAIAADPAYASAHRNLGILMDIYLQRPGEALAHYRDYDRLVGGGDEEVSRWIADLDRRLATARAGQGAQ
jgi:Flp pilus assembly protein TadD